jgi:hypothetical protein
MVAIGIAVVLRGYGGGRWGYCLLRGYNISARDIFSSRFPSSVAGSAAATTPAPPGRGTRGPFAQ